MADYIGWAKYVRQNNHLSRLVLCDSDANGAFKIYRHSQLVVDPFEEMMGQLDPLGTKERNRKIIEKRRNAKGIHGS